MKIAKKIVQKTSTPTHQNNINHYFRYFYSYQPIEEGGPNNGELATPKDQRNKHEHYYYWFDTYALEFAEFLLNSGLARGSYFHTLTANDAYYERNGMLVSILLYDQISGEK